MNKPLVYAVKHKDNDVISASRSGGIFTAVSDYVLNEGGVIYGCILNDKFEAVHIRAENKENRDKMRGSKYIQSRLGASFKRVKEDLLSGRLVLFTGTSCQVAGLRGFLEKEFDNLICMDVVCHGVPSPLVWKKYMLWLQKKTNAKIKGVNFRNKTDFGWRAHIESLYFENGKVIHSEIFKKLFFAHYILRPCCYECHYKSIMHPGDITIADYWGIEKAAPEYDDDKGVSLVLINNEVGKKLFEKIEHQLRYTETRIEDSMQPSLKGSFPCPSGRDKFWRELKSRRFGYIARHYGDYGYGAKVRRALKKTKKTILRKIKGMIQNGN